MKLIVTGFIFTCLLYGANAKCVMRGRCAVIGGFDKPCPVDEDPLPILLGISNQERAQLFDHLLQRCPFLLYDENGIQKPDSEILTCCDGIQLLSLSASLNIADGVLGRCPTCLKNFARQICEMNCSPDQARFVEVFNETTGDIAYVNQIDYRVYNDFMIDAHASCAGVLVPQTGMPAINLMCGNAPVCDADAWFGFTGDTSINPLAPVQVNFLRTMTFEDSMNARAPRCNETAEGDVPCGCIDCEITCPIGVEPIISEICTVMSINCISFSVSLIFFVLSTTIITLFTIREYRKNKSIDTKPSSPKKTKNNKVVDTFQSIFSVIGGFSASYPVLMIMLTTWILFAMLFGALKLRVTTNPIELWSDPTSQSRINLEYFNERFGPFYRAAQVYLQFKGLSSFVVGNVTYGPAFRLEAIQELVKLEDTIYDIGRDDGGVTLEQVCFAPLRTQGSTEQNIDECVSMSAATYFGEARNNINNNTYLNTMQNCINNYLSLDCMAPWGGGAQPEISFGGYDGDNILSADTLLINLPIANHLTEENLRPVLDWEQKFLELLHDYEAHWKADFVDVSFGAERSIEDEIQRVSNAEVIPIAISYIMMFIYVTISLGNVRNCRTWIVDSKMMVAIGSIIVVICAIFCALGAMGYAEITVTLLAINVVPFFVLSVGVDNVFFMVNTLTDIESKLKEYDDYNENFGLKKKRKFLFSKMMGKVGPSIFVSSLTQITCFGIGGLANFPAVRTFSIFVSISLGFLFIFQITTVLAILSVDYKRTSTNRFDILCCIQKKILNDSDPLNSEKPYRSVIRRLMNPYSTFLLKWWVKLIVVIVFVTILCLSIIVIPNIEVGLDQQMALPTDSYVYKYLKSVSGLLRLGPPVYFVLKSGLNFTNPEHQNVICGGQLCNEDSLATQIFLASRYSNVTYIYGSSNSWLDDFLDWSSLPGVCCKFNINDNSFCQSTDNSANCSYCSIPRDEWQSGLRPAPEAFEKYIPFFLQDTPTDVCNKGGLASYAGNVNYILDAEGHATVYDSNFMAYHIALGSSHDFITAVKYGYEIAANITAAIKLHTDLDVEVFAYSVFYVFFEQYLTMWADTFSSIGYCLISALFFNYIASGFNFLTTFTVMVTTIMVVLNMMGVMYIWSIPLNAVSCVNLIVSIGIAVEFCSHIAYAFATSRKPKEDRICDALESVGSTIITGITFTNLPIIVLAFSYTEIIEVFFFRMFFSIVVLGLLHGMVFYPVLLSYISGVSSK